MHIGQSGKILHQFVSLVGTATIRRLHRSFQERHIVHENLVELLDSMIDMLVVPMKNHEDEVVGVLQLLNSIDSISGEIVPFSDATQDLAVSVASQAAVAIANMNLA